LTCCQLCDINVRTWHK